MVYYFEDKKETNKNKITSMKLSIKRTKLANERTFLAYLRTGFAISTFAGLFKKWWIFTFGLIMICLSSIQYYYINLRLNNDINPNIIFLENLPLLYVILAFGILYLQWKK